MGVNYGCNKVRFPSPVPVGSKVRLGAKIVDVEDVAGGAQATSSFTFEVEGAPKPSCVAEVIFRYYVSRRSTGTRASPSRRKVERLGVAGSRSTTARSRCSRGRRTRWIFSATCSGVPDQVAGRPRLDRLAPERAGAGGLELGLGLADEHLG